MSAVRRTRSHTPFTPSAEQCTSLAKYFHELKTTINTLNIKSNKRSKLLEIVSNIEESICFTHLPGRKASSDENGPALPDTPSQTDLSEKRSGHKSKKGNKLSSLLKTKKKEEPVADKEEPPTSPSKPKNRPSRPSLFSFHKTPSEEAPAIQSNGIKREDSDSNLLEFLSTVGKDKQPFIAKDFDCGDQIFQTIQSSVANHKIHIPKSVTVQGQLMGPDNTEAEDRFGPNASARTISTYPIVSIPTPMRLGEPICDRFYAHLSEKYSIVAVADGCNWGEKPREAALLACNEVVNYVSDRLFQLTDVHEIISCLLKGFMTAHCAILSTREENYDPGTTTLLAGVLTQLAQPVDGKPWVFVCVTVGDCKAFFYSVKQRTFVDITTGNRMNLTDPRDCGGRLGPTSGASTPDLRNLQVYTGFLEEGDILTVVSDGVHDNFDPQLRGIPPTECKLDCPDWDTAEKQFPDQAVKVKSDYMISEMNSVVNKYKSVSPHRITKVLIKTAVQVTQACREFMEANPDARQPIDYALYPGKMDHTTCVAIRAKKMPQHPFGNMRKTISNPTSLEQFLAFVAANTELHNSLSKHIDLDLEDCDLGKVIQADIDFLETLYRDFDMTTDFDENSCFRALNLYRTHVLGEKKIYLSNSVHSQMSFLCKEFVSLSMREVESRMSILFKEFQKSRWMKFQCFQQLNPPVLNAST